MNIKSIEQIMAPWTAAHQEAALKEGWQLAEAALNNPTIQIQRIDDPEALPEGATHLPSDDAAMIMVRTGTGEHHSVARKIIHDHFPSEWALLEAAAASVS